MAVVKAESLKAHDHETADEKTRALYGCDKPVEVGAEWTFAGFVFDRCPSFYFNDPGYVQDVIRLWNWREKGILPFPGGLMEQPNAYIEAMEFMDYLMLERQKMAIPSFPGGARART